MEPQTQLSGHEHKHLPLVTFVLLGGLAIGAISGYFFGNAQGKGQGFVDGQRSGESIGYERGLQEAQLRQKDQTAAAVNPFSDNTNPFDQSVNPFDEVKVNPFE